MRRKQKRLLQLAGLLIVALLFLPNVGLWSLYRDRMFDNSPDSADAPGGIPLIQVGTRPRRLPRRLVCRPTGSEAATAASVVRFSVAAEADCWRFAWRADAACLRTSKTFPCYARSGGVRVLFFVRDVTDKMDPPSLAPLPSPNHPRHRGSAARPCSHADPDLPGQPRSSS